MRLALAIVCLFSAAVFAADYQPTATVTVDPSGDSVTLAWTSEGGWPSDMDVYHTAILLLDVDGVLVQAEVGGIVWTAGDTVYVSRMLTRPVYAGQCVTVVRIEEGASFSESMSSEWRTWEIAAGQSVANEAGE